MKVVWLMRSDGQLAADGFWLEDGKTARGRDMAVTGGVEGEEVVGVGVSVWIDGCSNVYVSGWYFWLELM